MCGANSSLIGVGKGYEARLLGNSHMPGDDYKEFDFAMEFLNGRSKGNPDKFVGGLALAHMEYF